MKLIVVLAVLGAVCAAPPSDFHLSSLIDDFHDFLKLIPIDQIKGIVNKHLENDAEFGNVIRYLQSDEWTKLVETIRAKPEVQDFAKYMTDAGLDVVGLVGKIHNYLASLKPKTPAGKDGSLRPFLDEVEGVIPLDKLIDLLNQKMENSKDFQAFYKRISSQQAKQLVEDVRALPEVQRLNKRLTEIGVDVKTIMEIIYEFLGWSADSEFLELSSLIDDFHDFLKLIPIDQIKNIVNKHLENDAEFGNVIRYLQSDEWTKLVETIRAKPEVQDFAKYMADAGLDVVGLVGKIHKYLASLKPKTPAGKDGSLRPFLDEVEGVIPLDKLIDLLNQKMENSKDFQAFYKRISSQQAKQLVEDVRALPEVQRLNKRLTEIGVDVKTIMEIIYEFLGWSADSEFLELSSLIDDFHDFLKLIPVDLIKNIVNKHLENDAEFGNVIRYLQSDEWTKLIETIRAKPEVQDFAKYMTDAGLDVVGFVAKIHKYLASLKPKTPAGKDGSLRPFLDEVEGVIPLDKLIDLLNQKMENSKDFQAFYKRISSQQAKQLVEEVRALPEVQRLNKRLTDVGVNIKQIMEIVYAFLGWN